MGRAAQLLNNPVAAQVRDLWGLAVRDGMDGSFVVTRLQGPDQDSFDSPHRALDFDMYARAERVGDQEKNA